MLHLKLVLKYLLGIAFALAGANHFWHTPFYLSMMPPYLSWHLFLVYLSGVLESTAGVALLLPGCTHLAAWSIIAISIGVFPANLHMALHSEQFPQFSAAALWIRLPLQAVIIAWAYWFTRPVAGLAQPVTIGATNTYNKI
jgi:uncharacterized membrane protein